MCKRVGTAVQCVRFLSRALVAATLSLAALRFVRGPGTSEENERRCQPSFGACSQDDATLVEIKRVLQGQAFVTSVNQKASLSICRVFEVKVTSVSCRTLF
jgi:hypothetical protein